jgi:hypothetical protein
MHACDEAGEARGRASETGWVARATGSSRAVRAPSCSGRPRRTRCAGKRRHFVKVVVHSLLWEEGYANAGSEQGYIMPNLELPLPARVHNEPARRRRPFAACGRSRPAQKFRRPGVQPRRRRGRGHAGGQAQRSFVRGRHASRARTTSVKVSLPRRWWRPASFCRGALGSSPQRPDCGEASTHQRKSRIQGVLDRPRTVHLLQRTRCQSVELATRWSSMAV